MYLNNGRILRCRVLTIIQIILGSLFSIASISVTLDYFKPSQGKDLMDKGVAIMMTLLFLWILYRGIKAMTYLGRADAYKELFESQREKDILTYREISEIHKKPAADIGTELRWLIKKDCLVNCCLQKGTMEAPEGAVILEGPNIKKVHYVKIICESCGAANKVEKGQTAACEYCGSLLTTEED